MRTGFSSVPGLMMATSLFILVDSRLWYSVENQWHGLAPHTSSKLMHLFKMMKNDVIKLSLF